MENTEERIAMLNQIPSPAFIVSEGVITHVNEAAQHLQLATGDQVDPLFTTGAVEYASFTSGNLYLTMSICGIDTSVCVTDLGHDHLFTVEPEEDLA